MSHIFCQKKIIANLNSGKSSRLYQPAYDYDKEYMQMIHRSATNMIGGWGYFLIERGANASTSIAKSSENSIALYLYKEGE